MSLKEFKWLDLLIFSILATIFEVINYFASVSLFDNFKLMFMSFNIVLTLISIYRWGISGIIVIIFSSLIGVVVTKHNTDYTYYIIYIIGGALGLTLGYLLFQLLLGRKKLNNKVLLVTYLVFDFMFVILFRCLIAGLFNNNFSSTFINNLKGLCIQECMSLFISSVILLTAARKKGNIVVEMKQYTKEVKDLKKLGGLKELKEQSNFNSDSPYTEFNQIDESTILDGGVMNVDQLNELEKIYKENDNINVSDPLDVLTKKDKVD